MGTDGSNLTSSSCCCLAIRSRSRFSISAFSSSWRLSSSSIRRCYCFSCWRRRSSCSSNWRYFCCISSSFLSCSSSSACRWASSSSSASSIFEAWLFPATDPARPSSSSSLWSGFAAAFFFFFFFFFFAGACTWEFEASPTSSSAAFTFTMLPSGWASS